MDVKLPKAMSEKLAEEIGLHIGDGSMGLYQSGGIYSLRGNKISDRTFYEGYIKNLYKQVYKIDVVLREWDDVIGFQICSKPLVKYKHECFRLPMGPKGNIGIPKVIMKDEKLSVACIRGIFDTDGNFYLEKKKGKLYPRIHICTTSKRLANQIKRLIKLLGFSSFSMWTTKNKNWRVCYRMCIRGYKNCLLWYKVIGSSHPKHIQEFERLFKS
ncbi:MAG: hypothetical protein NTY73_03815 [Candidatus Micrarchaeota archaeon]|nr:hypothetical protein [Candidatus Micrarchaeota archaeon]